MNIAIEIDDKCNALLKAIQTCMSVQTEEVRGKGVLQTMSQ